MNAVEIEEAISELALQEFDAENFPFAFLEAFGNKATTIKMLQSGRRNATDIDGAVLQRGNIHIKVCEEGAVAATLTALKESPATTKAKAKFVLATDGVTFEAENLGSGETIACEYKDFPDHFGFFLALAGISTVKQIRENAFDIKATSRLNRLYVQLLQDNPDWGTEERRHDMNHFMARLIFCFFAEDTDIFNGTGLFTSTIEQMSTRDSSNTHEVISEIFRAMNTKIENRAQAKLPRWADAFPYVNGGLFSGSTEAPKFTKIARSYLIHIGNLDWQKINPDIFGSMIQAVADDEERGSLGMHYTSVPNILKVLNPLFLDDLQEQLEAAGDSAQKLANLRRRISKIRIFDPACGSGNFLVISYKEMRKIEFEINKRRGEPDRRTEIPLTNFRGIEIRDFSAEIARLALIIAEYQCDVLYRGQKEALAEFLPLNAMNWITQGNALRLDWLNICPPTGKGVKLVGDDLFNTPLDQAEIDFENEGGETYICGNPPFSGVTKQLPEQKEDLKVVFSGTKINWKSLDYVCGFFFKCMLYSHATQCRYALVSTNSISQGQIIPYFWSKTLNDDHKIRFAHTSFNWKNLARNNAGVIVVIIGLDREKTGKRFIFNGDQRIECEHISPYLSSAKIGTVSKSSSNISQLPEMTRGSIPNCGGNFIFSHEERTELQKESPKFTSCIYRYVGSQELSKGIVRYCITLQSSKSDWRGSKILSERVTNVERLRLQSKKQSTREILAKTPSHFEFLSSKGESPSLAIPRTTSVNRPYLAADLLPSGWIVNDNAYFVENPSLWVFSIVVSKTHLAWIATVCGKMKNDYRYSNTLGWNTFPLPKLTEKNKQDLTRCAEDILLAREMHFPATIADLYDPEAMPENLRHAHERNDEVLERIYIGRRFKNDTERLEKLFELYTKMTTKKAATA